MKFLVDLAVVALLFSLTTLSFGDTPPPGTVAIKGGTDGTKIGNVGDSLKVSGSFSLPSGAATAALQTAGNASLSSINGKITAVDTDNVTVSSSALPAGAATSVLQTTGNSTLSTISSTLTTLNGKVTAVDTDDVTVSSSALPSGASTSALQTSGNSTLSTISSTLSTLNGKVTAADTGNVTVSSSTGRSSVQLARNDYSSVNVTTSAYVTLVTSLADNVNEIDIFDSSGQTLVLAVGGAGTEVDKTYIVKGGNGPVSLAIAAGSRVSIKAVTATANVGELDVTFLK